MMLVRVLDPRIPQTTEHTVDSRKPIYHKRSAAISVTDKCATGEVISTG